METEEVEESPERFLPSHRRNQYHWDYRTTNPHQLPGQAREIFGKRWDRRGSNSKSFKKTSTASNLARMKIALVKGTYALEQWHERRYDVT